VDVLGEDPVVDDALDRLRDQEVEHHHAEQQKLRDHQPAPTTRVGPDGGKQLTDVRGPHQARTVPRSSDLSSESGRCDVQVPTWLLWRERHPRRVLAPADLRRARRWSCREETTRRVTDIGTTTRATLSTEQLAQILRVLRETDAIELKVSV